MNEGLKTFCVYVTKDLNVNIQAQKATVETNQSHDLLLNGDGNDASATVARFSTWLFYKVVEQETLPAESESEI